MKNETWRDVVAYVENRFKEVPSFMMGYDIFASRLKLSPDDWLDLLKRLEEDPKRAWELKVELRGSQRILVFQKK
jgi:hypothetical protein